MPSIKLTYFDINGGRGESIRLALAIGGIEFEDDRFPFAEFPAVRERTPLGQVPVMEIDGEAVTQSNSMNRYVGKLAGLYPDDPLQALYCDEAMAIVEDALKDIVQTFGIEDPETLKAAREALVEGPITLFLGRLDAILTERGGRYFAGDRLSVADLKVFVWTRGLASGNLDHVPTDIVEQVAPALADHRERIAAEPGVVEYYRQR